MPAASARGAASSAAAASISFSEMSELSQTFETSSWSSRASISLRSCWAFAPSRAIVLSASFLISASSGSMPAFLIASRTASNECGVV